MVSRETPILRWMSDRGICIATGPHTLSLYRRLLDERLPGVAEVVPADGSLLLVLASGAPVPPGLLAFVQEATDEAERADMPPPKEHEVPVRFNGDDLADVARRAGLATESLAELMCSLTLRVKFLGFQPGFAYLAGLPAQLSLPRRARPRKVVPAGSVALAGGYCGIYPSAGPGGWHLIGSTDIPLFDPAASPPARFLPGDVVRLVAA